MFLLGLFSGPIQTGNLGDFESWTDLVSFYSGIDFVIGGFVLLSLAWSTTLEKRIGGPTGAEEQELSRKRRLSHLPTDLGIALIVGVVVSAANTFAVWDRFASSSGFPFQVKSPYPGCFGPFLGECFTFHPWALLLDGILWTGLAFVMVALADILTTLYAQSRLTSVTLRKINQ